MANRVNNSKITSYVHTVINPPHTLFLKCFHGHLYLLGPALWYLVCYPSSQYSYTCPLSQFHLTTWFFSVNHSVPTPINLESRTWVLLLVISFRDTHFLLHFLTYTQFHFTWFDISACLHIINVIWFNTPDPLAQDWSSLSLEWSTKCSHYFMQKTINSVMYKGLKAR